MISIEKRYLLYLSLILVIGLSSFSKSNERTSTFVSSEGVAMSLSFIPSNKFQLTWNEGLCNFELFGSYTENKGEIRLSREDAFYIEQIYEDIQSDSSVLRILQSVSQFPVFSKTSLALTFFDSIHVNGKQLDRSIQQIRLTEKDVYRLYTIGRVIDIDPSINAVFREVGNKYHLNLVMNYPNYLIAEDEIVLLKKGNKQLVFKNLFPGKKLIKKRG
jgi:hypothetical protein